MLCIPVASESRTLARADLLNACRVGDLVELCLDRLSHRPDVSDLISGLSKPVIVSCRRKKDGGHFRGTEEERVELLREALIAGPQYIELELDIAAHVPRKAGTKRIISINRLFRALNDVDDLMAKAINAGADVVKFTWPGVLVNSLEPVLKLLNDGPRIPVVGLPVGHGSRAFGILARRLGCPWVYAALERGMETSDGIPTAQDLTERFRANTITRETRIIAAIGFGAVRERTIRAYNAAFEELGLDCRCVPLEIGPVEGLGELLDLLQVVALLVAPGLGDYLFPLVQHPEPAAAIGQHVDLILRKKEGWYGYNVLWRSVLKVVERTLRRQPIEHQTLESSNNLVLGAGRIARTILFGLRQMKGTAALSSPQSDEVAFCPHCGEALGDDPVEEVAKATDSRYVPFTEVVSTRPDVLIVTDPGLNLGFTPATLNPLFLQPPLTVVDATSLFEETDLLVEARDRGCTVVRPKYILGEHLAAQFKAITGQELPDAAFQQALSLE